MFIYYYFLLIKSNNVIFWDFLAEFAVDHGNSILLMDRGYYGEDLIKFLKENQIDSLVRLKIGKTAPLMVKYMT